MILIVYVYARINVLKLFQLYTCVRIFPSNLRQKSLLITNFQKEVKIQAPFYKIL